MAEPLPVLHNLPTLDAQSLACRGLPKTKAVKADSFFAAA